MLLYRSDYSSSVSKGHISTASVVPAHLYHIRGMATCLFLSESKRGKKKKTSQEDREKYNKKCVKRYKIISWTILWMPEASWMNQAINLQHLEALITAVVSFLSFFFFLVFHFKHLQWDSVNHRAQSFVNIITLSCGSSILPNSKIQCQYFWDNVYLTFCCC